VTYFLTYVSASSGISPTQQAVNDTLAR